MSYGLMYTVPFADISNTPCVVEIEKDGYVGTPTELVGGSGPFVVKIDDEEFMYTPTRFSDATIKLVGGDSLQRLFATGYQEYRVTFKKNGSVRWCGFVKPEVYTQDYSSNLFELEIECMSAMSTLEYVNYELKDDQFISLFDILKYCIRNSNGKYDSVYIPVTYSIGNIDVNAINELRIAQQNFFDEDGKPMKYKEILEEICKLFSLTCVDYLGSLYFVDVDNSGKYYKYTSDLGIQTPTEYILPNEVNIQINGFRGSDHTLDILPGYNKVTVKDSNYAIKDYFSEKDEEKQLLYSRLLSNSNYTEYSRENYIYTNDRYKAYKRLSFGETVKVDLLSYKDNSEVRELFGMVPIQYSNYKTKLSGGLYVPDINEYSYVDAIQMRVRSQYSPTYIFESDRPIYSVKIPPAVYIDSAIGISGLIKPINDPDLSPISPAWLFMYGNTDPLIVSVRVGNKYWSGSYWSDTPTTFKIKYSLDPSETEFVSFKNQKELDMPYPGIGGNIIPLRGVSGELELIMYRPAYIGDIPYGAIIKDLKVTFANAEYFPKNDSDRIYENVVNDKYINELDEIELKISTYNDDGSCWSKLILNNAYVTDNIYSHIEGINVRLEESIIRRIIDRYGGTKIKLTQVIKESADITPITRLSDNFSVNKKYLVTGGEIDYVNETFTCVMTEL